MSSEDQEYQTNLLRMIASELYYSLSLTTAREMYEKSYFSLGQGEKAIVDQTVNSSVSANYKQLMTADNLKSALGVGFDGTGQSRPS